MPVNRSSAPSFPNGYLPGRSCAPRRRRNPTPGKFSGLSQLAELSFTLSVLGVTGDHKGCPGVVDFSHLVTAPITSSDAARAHDLDGLTRIQ